jgi:hypothetical protein
VHVHLYIICISSRPYTSRSSSSGGGEGSTGRSVFNRLGGPAEGAFARLSGLGGDRRGESWHKVTVSMNRSNLVPKPSREGERAWYTSRSCSGRVTIVIACEFCMTCKSMDDKWRVYDSVRLPACGGGSQ